MKKAKQYVSNKLIETAKKNMSQWFKALETKNAKKVAELYTENATFLPTVSKDFKRGQKGAEEYFNHFLAKNPKGQIIDEAFISISEDAYLHCGMYDFELDEENKQIILHARFDYLWKKNNNGEWKISHHHSSLRPD